MPTPAARPRYSQTPVPVMGVWYCIEYPAVGEPRFLTDHVHDDFGNLVPLTPEAEHRNQAFWHDWRGAVDESAAQFINAQAAAIEAAHRERAARESTRALLCPTPIVVEIAEPDDFGDTPIRIGADPRYVNGAPTYRLEIAGNDHVYITQAQLAALLVAGEALCKRKRATPRRKASQ